MKSKLVSCIQAIQSGQSGIDADTAFIELRSLSPSDEFVESLAEIIMDQNELSDVAIILFNNDLKRNDQEAAVWRVDNPQLTEIILQKFLNLLTQKQSPQLNVIVSELAWGLKKRGQSMDAVLNFVASACQNQSEAVKAIGLSVLSDLCDTSVLDLMQIQEINILGLLQEGLQLQNEQASLSSLKALSNIVNNNVNDQMEPIIPIEVVVQIFSAMVHRASMAIAQQQECAVKMMGFIMRVLELQLDVVVSQTPEVVQLCAAVLQAGEALDEKLRKVAFLMFQALLLQKDWKQYSQVFFQFLQEIAFPCAIATADEMKAVVEAPTILTGVDSNTLADVAFETIVSMAFQFGKVAVYPLLDGFMKRATASDATPQDALLGVYAAKAASSGMADTLKAKEAQAVATVCFDVLSDQRWYQNTYLLMECAQAIGAIAGDLKERLIKIQKQMLQKLCSFCINIASGKLLSLCMCSLTNINAYCKYEVTVRALPSLLPAVKKGLNESLDAQIEAISVLTSICEVCGMEDIGQFLQENFQGIFTLFTNLMAASQAGQEFTYQEQQLIYAVMSLMSTACSTMPEALGAQVDIVLSAMVMLVRRATAQLEHEMLQKTIEALSLIAQAFPDNTGKILDQICEPMLNILKEEVTQASKTILKEQEITLKEHLIDQQIAAMNLFKFLAEKQPQQLAVCFEELFQITVAQFEPINSTQRHAWLGLMTELLHVATILYPQNYLQYHEQLFKLFSEQMLPVNQDGVRRMNLVNLSECDDTADVLFYYIKYYLKAHLIYPDPNYQSTQELLLAIIQHISQKAKLLLKSFVAGMADNTYVGKEELESSVSELFEEYSDAMRQIKYCWGQFIFCLKDDMSNALFSVIQTTVQEWVTADAETTPGKSEIENAFDLMAQAAGEFCSERAQAFWAPLYQTAMSQFWHTKKHLPICTQWFYALVQFYKKTNFMDPTTEALMQTAVETLDEAEEDGSDDAMAAYDNACVFLLFAGKHSAQGAQFWETILEKVSNMGVDEFEALRAATFIMENMDAFVHFKLENQAVKAVVSIGLGNNYTYYQKEDEEGVMPKIKQFLSERMQITQAAAQALNDEIVTRNLNLFFSQ